MSNKEISYYLALPYTFVLRRDDEGDVVARIEELEGCVAHGADESEAIKNLREVQRLWLEDCLEAGHVVPEPELEEDLPSGKWVQRVPRSLHQKLAQMAKRENVSLNQLVTSLLSESLSKRNAEAMTAVYAEKVIEQAMAKLFSIPLRRAANPDLHGHWPGTYMIGAGASLFYRDVECQWSMTRSPADVDLLDSLGRLLPRPLKIQRHAEKQTGKEAHVRR